MSPSWINRVAESILPLSQETSDVPRALREWFYSGDMYDIEEPVENCQLCGHPNIRYQFEILNIHTSNSLLIGSECINRFGILSFDERGRLLTQRETRTKVRRDRAKLIADAKKRSVIQSLVELVGKDANFDIHSFIAYFQDKGAFTPNQLFLLIWRLDQKRISYTASHLKMIIRRDREKNQLLAMPDWKVKKLWSCMSSTQKRFYTEEQ